MSGSGAGSVAQVTKRTSGIAGFWPRRSCACSPMCVFGGDSLPLRTASSVDSASRDRTIASITPARAGASISATASVGGHLPEPRDHRTRLSDRPNRRSSSHSDAPGRRHDERCTSATDRRHCDAARRSTWSAVGSGRVGRGQLRLLALPYIGFDGATHTRRDRSCTPTSPSGCVGVFKRLYDSRTRSQRMVLVDAYGGSDDASVVANDASACRLPRGHRRQQLVRARVRKGDRRSTRCRTRTSTATVHDLRPGRPRPTWIAAASTAGVIQRAVTP